MMTFTHKACAILSILTLLSGAACSEAPEAPDAHTQPVAWMSAHTTDFLSEDSTAWRRARLEETLWRPELGYSIKLLSHYGYEDEGWELLSEYDFAVEPVAASTAKELSSLPFKGTSLLKSALSDAGVSDPKELSDAQLKALGREVFWQLPMRRDNYMEWLVRQPELWGRYGLDTDSQGNLRGIVRYQDARGEIRVGMTCALCHAAQGVEGRAHTQLELGPARAAFHRAYDIDEGVFSEWGAGQVDVTDDNVTDPMAIPNLWGMKYQRYFNGSGVIRVETPASAAIRFETQYIMNHGYEVRPPRALTWSLAMWLYDLEEPESTIDLKSVARGKSVFMAKCASCHNPDAGYSGGLIAADSLYGTDQLASQSIDRGTGSYRVPSLVGIGQGGPYFHDSSAQSLGDVLNLGHPYGAPLDEQDELIHFLNTL